MLILGFHPNLIKNKFRHYICTVKSVTLPLEIFLEFTDRQ